jgi:phage/plasmid-associated DNA primase
MNPQQPKPGNLLSELDEVLPPNDETGPSSKKKRPETSFELELVERLRKTLPPIITLGERWFVCQDGLWIERARHHYHPEALNIIEPKYRTTRMASQVLRHLEGSCQAKESPFYGAYKFDGNDLLISVQNGVIRLRAEFAEPEHDEFVLKVSLEQALSQNYFTQKLAVPFEPEARCTAFSQALVENLPDPDDQKLFGLFCASVLVPDCRWEAALCVFGETGTGKSTLFEGIQATLGKGPCQALSLTELCDQKSYNAPDLQFAMLNISTELNALELTSDRFKQLVSGERVPVRAIYGSPYYIDPTCKYVGLTNHLPRFKDGTGAELRRLRFLKFNQLPLIKDLQLKKRVATEGSGILNLLIRLVSALLRAPEMPYGGQDSAQARERFQIANDPVGSFVQTECVLGPECYEAKDRLEARFKTFLAHHGLRDTIATILFKQLYERFNVAPMRRRDGAKREQGASGIELKPITDSSL